MEDFKFSQALSWLVCVLYIAVQLAILFICLCRSLISTVFIHIKAGLNINAGGGAQIDAG